ncbi:DUF1353 domain-containing protein [Vibrio ulleungensis]|uniref:DUF1353 domain-containing protein n=1 Tax=Vibrio ulleungensis TaxID=2807619 RepID=A0ABS2HDC6_9VIBR|nr:DUF1353 domain-containing protein [Vibrio ulleungensis]MBM7034999.1 DUF1353 domain-containing protein [Vibrio ulleungensis]
MRNLIVLVLLTIIPCMAFSQADYGSYVGTVKTEWMRGSESERRMVLLEDFVYIDPKGKKWIAPAGSKTDGATIPKVVWTFVGGPYAGQYREAAVIHDVYCDTKSEPYRDVHRIFYYANRAAGVSEKKAKILYGGVMIGGPKWGSKESNCYSCHSTGSTKMEKDNNGQLTAFPPVTEDDVKMLAEFVNSKNPTLEQIDAYIEKVHPASKFGH